MPICLSYLLLLYLHPHVAQRTRILKIPQTSIVHVNMRGSGVQVASSYVGSISSISPVSVGQC